MFKKVLTKKTSKRHKSKKCGKIGNVIYLDIGLMNFRIFAKLKIFIRPL